MSWPLTPADMLPAARVMTRFAEIIAAFVIVSGLLQNLLYLWQLVLAAWTLRTRPPIGTGAHLWRRYADAAPPITLLAPAFNEEATVVESVRSLLALHYPNFEIVVINDGSKDDTLGVLVRAFELQPVQRNYDLAVPCNPIRGVYTAANQPRLIVVDKVNGGKADALNAGINLARAPIVCGMDADSLLEPDALLRAVRPFIEDPDHTVAVGGAIRVVNGCKVDHGLILEVGLPRNLLALFQTVEYLRSFLLARIAWSRAGALTIISGAFGLFNRQSVVEVGGYSHGTVGEDMELVVKLHRLCRDRGGPYRIAFEPEAVCWTEVPESLQVLARQRARWHRGALETFFKHRDMVFSPRYGRVGWLAMGSVLLIDVIGPVVEAVGYLLIPAFWLTGTLSLGYLEAFVSVSFVFGVLISVGALTLEESELRRFRDARSLVILMLAAVVENFGYRQLNTLWRMRGTWQYLTGAKGWGTMTRRGFKAAA